MKKTALACCFLLLSVWSISVSSQTATPPGNISDPDAGSQANPYQIASLKNLFWIAEQVNEHNNSFENKFFKQTANINADVTSTWFDELGWTPIGNQTTTFSGTYDGNDKHISNLSINREVFVGLFGATDGASLKNISITDADIRGVVFAGALVGQAKNTFIDKSQTVGTVSGTVGVGGLTGVAENSSISNSSAYGTVTGEVITGGLTGLAENTSISNSYANGAVYGLDVAGGLAGLANIASISNCHAIGSVSGMVIIGGLAGIAEKTDIYSSYATGSVSGMVAVGGLVGLADEIEIDQCYSNGNITAIDTDEESLFLAGGLAGIVDENSTIKDSYSNSSIFYDMDFDDDVIAGGFIGLNGAAIENCYSTGAILPIAIPKSTHPEAALNKNDLINTITKHSKRVKELSGYDLDLSYLISSLENISKSAATVYKGGFIAINDQINISNSFWDKETSTLENGIGIGESALSGLTGKRTTQMKLIGTYNDTSMEGLDTPWNIAYPSQNTVWHITNVSTGFVSYPFLAYSEYDEDNDRPGYQAIPHTVLNLHKQNFYATVQEAINDSSEGDKIVFTGTFESIDATDFGITLSPGMSPGCATITDVFTLSSTETLEIDINGYTPCDHYDQITVEGVATLGNSTLIVVLGFAPELDDEFVVIESDNPITGEFAENTVTAVYGRQLFVFSIDYSNNAVTLKVTEIKRIPISEWSLLVFAFLVAIIVFVRVKPLV